MPSAQPSLTAGKALPKLPSSGFAAAPVREASAHRPPPDAFPDQVADRIDGIAAAAPSRAAAPALLPGRSWQRGLGDRPFGVAHVRRIARRPGAAADAARAAAAPHRPAGRPGIFITGPGPRTLGTRGSSSVPG